MTGSNLWGPWGEVQKLKCSYLIARRVFTQVCGSIGVFRCHNPTEQEKLVCLFCKAEACKCNELSHHFSTANADVCTPIGQCWIGCLTGCIPRLKCYPLIFTACNGDISEVSDDGGKDMLFSCPNRIGCGARKWAPTHMASLSATKQSWPTTGPSKRDHQTRTAGWNACHRYSHANQSRRLFLFSSTRLNVQSSGQTILQELWWHSVCQGAPLSTNYWNVGIQSH